MKTIFAVGNLGRDAEVKTINEKEYINFSLALHESKDETPEWADVLFRVRNAEFKDKLTKYLEKGKPVAVVGRSTINAYKDKDGNARASETIWADKISFINTGKGDKAAEPAGSAPEASESDFPF